MDIRSPFGLIAFIVVIYFFYTTMRRRRFIQEDSRARRDEIFQCRQQLAEEQAARLQSTKDAGNLLEKPNDQS